MAVTTAFCDSAKREFLSGVHLPAHVYKLALIRASSTGTYNSASTGYAQLAGDEVANGNGYTTGGNTLAGITYALGSNTASIDWSDSQWTSASISSEGAMIYNASIASSAALGVYSFGGTVTSTSGTFTVTIPTSGTGVIRIA